MTADVFVLLDCGWCEWLQTRVCCRSYEHSDTYDCRRVHRVVIVEVLPQLRTLRHVRLQTRAWCHNYERSDANDCRRMCAVVTVEVLL